MPAEIYCNIDRKWSAIVSHEIILPDVAATLAACGHKLPIWSDLRETPDAVPATPPEPAPSPDHLPMQAGAI